MGFCKKHSDKDGRAFILPCSACHKEPVLQMVTSVATEYNLDMKTWPASCFKDTFTSYSDWNTNIDYTRIANMAKQVVELINLSYPGMENKYNEFVNGSPNCSFQVIQTIDYKTRCFWTGYTMVKIWLKERALEHAKERAGLTHLYNGRSHLPSGPFSDAFEVLIAEHNSTITEIKEKRDVEAAKQAAEWEKKEKERKAKEAAAYTSRVEAEARKRIAKAADEATFEAAVAAKMKELKSDPSTLPQRTKLRNSELSGLF